MRNVQQECQLCLWRRRVQYLMPELSLPVDLMKDQNLFCLCLDLICFCGINSCIAFKRVVFKTVHCVFTEVCSVVLCMQLRRVESFDLIPSQLAFRKIIRCVEEYFVDWVAH